ncbi:MAG: purine-nucleoside phosphorylase [Acholeplasmatales bacterium]|jgi:purine-nucleoside phosphorylase|nr:purine-nucleoside phosphorylase [Acholeplasmatales bacterium]
MSTPHIELNDLTKIASSVLMPGDPLRAKWIAETFLTDVIQFNSVRNILGYTGYYKGKKVSVMASGMGMPSIGIYSYELYKFYNVENIIRIGSAGSYDRDLKIYDVVLAKRAYTDSTYAKAMGVTGAKNLSSNRFLNQKIKDAAYELNIRLVECNIHSSDNFYYDEKAPSKIDQLMAKGIRCVEMESFALFANALSLRKKATCLLTISDNLITHEATTSEERQSHFKEMVVLALESLL